MTEPAAGMEPLLSDGMVVVGQDPASVRNCGWAVLIYAGGAIDLIEKYTQILDPEQGDLIRLKDIYSGLQKIIDRYNPHVLCLERSMGGGLSFVRNNLSENVGVCKLCCFNNGVAVHEISPSHLKKVITGSGKAKKKHIKANVKATFGLKTMGSEHECDAVAFAICYLVDIGWDGYEVKVPCDLVSKRKGKKRVSKNVANRKGLLRRSRNQRDQSLSRFFLLLESNRKSRRF